MPTPTLREAQDPCPAETFLQCKCQRGPRVLIWEVVWLKSTQKTVEEENQHLHWHLPWAGTYLGPVAEHVMVVTQETEAKVSKGFMA